MIDTIIINFKYKKKKLKKTNDNIIMWDIDYLVHNLTLLKSYV